MFEQEQDSLAEKATRKFKDEAKERAENAFFDFIFRQIIHGVISLAVVLGVGKIFIFDQLIQR